MEFNEKLQELRKQKGLTQEELAEALYVSRTAVSKWESGRGMPNIESLKAISVFFKVTLGDLLSSDELLVIAEDDSRQNANHLRHMVFGLLDCSMALLLFLPLFGQNVRDEINAVALFGASSLQPYLKMLYIASSISMTVSGIITLALQNCTSDLWTQNNTQLSLLLHTAVMFLFIISRQPYAAAFVFVSFIFKVLILLRHP